MVAVPIEEAKERLEELLAEAARGGKVEIEAGDGSIFEIVPLSEPKKKRGLIGSAKGQVWMADDFDEPLEDFEGG